MSASDGSGIIESPEHAETNPFLERRQGKQSGIYGYCTDPVRKDGRCVWLCRRQGRRVIAWDIQLQDPEQSVIDLGSQNRWWSRYSFYNFVVVQHVEIKFLQANRVGRGFQVIARAVDNTDAIAERQRALDESGPFDEPWGCGVDIKGRRHDDDHRCDNWYEDDFHGGCRVKDYVSCKQEIKNLRWMPFMLDYYWRNGLGEDGLHFLQSSGFVVSYEYLSEDRYQDAEDPYGKSISALMLVSGWRVRRLLWTILVTIVCDFCIVAVITLLSGAVDTGLAVGSYAVGIEALLLALLTMLSAILP